MEICKGVCKTVDLAFGHTGYIGGGFIRDVENGIEPKDIDLFVEARGTDTDQIDQFARALYTTFGQEFELEGQHAKEDNDGDEYPQYLRVYKATKVPEDQYPINLIVTPVNHPHSMEFDIGICEVYGYYRRERDAFSVQRTRTYQRDIDNKTLTILRIQDPMFQAFEDMRNPEVFSRSLERHLRHLARVKEKFPEHRVVFEQDFLASEYGRQAYPVYLERGFIEEPRTLLPAEVEGIDWDALRQQDGARFVQDVQRQQERAVADLARMQGQADFFAQLQRNDAWQATLQAGARVVRR